MTRALVVLLEGRRAALLSQEQSGVLSLTYDADYRESGALSLSLSMPLSNPHHDATVVRAFCQGLLPDNEDVLDRWGREFHVSSGNPFALLRHVGEDCAGAAQFVVPERVAALLAREGAVTWLDEEQIAERLRTLRRDPSAWHLGGTGQFSLAGAQAKTALHLDAKTGRWGDPVGAAPTTHILKPAIAGLDDHDLNEHLCLRAARLAGLPTATSQVLTFAGERAVVVERYDRLPRPDGSVGRIHQEDICQALGLSPRSKYQYEGGPSAEQVIALIRQSVGPPPMAAHEVDRFVDALAFNWLMAGTDAHAKNYSLLLASGEVRLAPLYDLASSLPYEDFYLPRLRLAMKIGSEYQIEAITGRHWRAFALLNRLDPDLTIKRVHELAQVLPSAVRQAADSAEVAELDSALPGRLVSRVEKHAERCRRVLETG